MEECGRKIGSGLRIESDGGGRGARLISPMRSRVNVSWAFVGIPLRIELVYDQ